MNRTEYERIIDEIITELTSEGGSFCQLFGIKTEAELKEARLIAAIALTAADRLYSNITKQEFDSWKNK